MKQSLVSIVIPTLRRSDTLRAALDTALGQDYPHCEIVVQNNGCDPDVESLVEALGDDRVRHFSTPTVLPMSDNWETALSHATGELVTFIGDDDGLLPDACSVAINALDQHGGDIVSWSPFWYFWPNYFETEFQGRLLATVSNKLFADTVSSIAELSKVYAFEATYDRLPMIYNSFVHKRVIKRARETNGRYFLGKSPDVVSGIVNAAMTESFTRLSRPLSVTGTSQHSTGHLIAYSSADLDKAISVRRDFESIVHDQRLPDNNLLPIWLARDMLLLQQGMLSHDCPIVFDFRGLMNMVAASANDNPNAYDEVVASIDFLGRTHSIDTADIGIPPRGGKRSAPVPEVKKVADDLTSFVIDGQTLGLRDIADAVRLVSQLVPRQGAEGIKSRSDLTRNPHVIALEDEVVLLRRECDTRLSTIVRLDADLKQSHLVTSSQIDLLQKTCDERLQLIIKLDAALKLQK